jgi:hypothetical protein
VADVYYNAKSAEMLDLVAFGYVGARYHKAHSVEHLGQRRHGYAAYSDEMSLPAGGHIITKFIHIKTPDEVLMLFS